MNHLFKILGSIIEKMDTKKDRYETKNLSYDKYLFNEWEVFT